VLRRPLEPEQYTSIRFTDHLDVEQIAPSIGSVGDAYDNALMESIIGLYKAECVDTDVFHPGPYKASATSNTPPPDGSTGTTTADSTARSATSRRSSSNKPTTLPSTPRCSQYESGTKVGTLQTSMTVISSWLVI
jgi:transposase InsO family protein